MGATRMNNIKRSIADKTQDALRKYADQKFMDWLAEANSILPGTWSLTKCQKLFEEYLMAQEELKINPDAKIKNYGQRMKKCKKCGTERIEIGDAYIENMPLNAFCPNHDWQERYGFEKWFDRLPSYKAGESPGQKPEHEKKIHLPVKIKPEQVFDNIHLYEQKEHSMQQEQSPNQEKLKHELEKLYAYLHGAHSATNETKATATFNQACHKIDEILKEVL
jgi:hypothetical protein